MNKFIRNSIQYSEYLKNKRVIVCGPGDILTNKNTGKKIDSYDVIVRLNNSYPVNINNKKSNIEIGTRTDVLYHTGAINTCLRIAANRNKIGRIELLKNDGIKFIVSKRDPINGKKRDKAFLNKFIKLNNNYIKKNPKESQILLVPVFNRFLGELQNILNKSDPNMSTLAIIHLLTYDIAKLEIVGCDFYNTGYHNHYTIANHIKWDNTLKKLVRIDGKKRRKAKIPHDYSIQIKFLLKVFENDERVEIDKNIINNLKRKVGE